MHNRKKRIMKLFKTNKINIIEECRVIFGATLPSLLITRKTRKFISKLKFLDNFICNLFT